MNKLVRFICSIHASFIFMFWVFIAFIILLLTTLFFGKKKDKQYLVFLYRVIGELVTKGMFLNVEKKIHYQFDENESYVVVSNHQTAIDIPANVNGAPKEILFKFLGKKEADRIPFFGFIIHRLCILVDRKSDNSRKASYLKMKEEMANGYSIFIYPEGTRNRTNKPLKDFYDGAFRLAIEMQKPIVVNTLVGIRKLNPPTHFFTYMPGKIESHWDAPISTKGMTLEDISALKKQVADVMIARLENE